MAKKKREAPQNKAEVKAPENKVKVYEVDEDYCGIPKGTIIDHTKFKQTTINDMVKKGYWICK